MQVGDLLVLFVSHDLFARWQRVGGFIPYAVVPLRSNAVEARMQQFIGRARRADRQERHGVKGVKGPVGHRSHVRWRQACRLDRQRLPDVEIDIARLDPWSALCAWSGVASASRGSKRRGSRGAGASSTGSDGKRSCCARSARGAGIRSSAPHDCQPEQHSPLLTAKPASTATTEKG